jgi:hypothetical protein
MTLKHRTVKIHNVDYHKVKFPGLNGRNRCASCDFGKLDTFDEFSFNKYNCEQTDPKQTCLPEPLTSDFYYFRKVGKFSNTNPEPAVSATKPTNPKDSIGIRKAPMSTVPANVIAEIGVAMLEGSAKYGRHNYREAGVRSSVYYDAAMRHLISWWEGEDIDPDSGMSHITKVLACLTVFRDAMMRDMVTDDRPPKSENFYELLNKLSGEILDRHADKSPKHVTHLNVQKQVE